MHALVLISNAGAQVHEGCLSTWPPAMDDMREYYSYPSDCYSVQIEQMATLQIPVALMHKVSRHIGSGGVSSSLALATPLFFGVWDASIDELAWNESATSQGICTAWNIRGELQLRLAW